MKSRYIGSIFSIQMTQDATMRFVVSGKESCCRAVLLLEIISPNFFCVDSERKIADI